MTTSPGHKSTLHLIEAEAYRRIMAGEAPATLAEFAQQLLGWLRQSVSRGLTEHAGHGRERDPRNLASSPRHDPRRRILIIATPAAISDARVNIAPDCSSLRRYEASSAS